MKEEIETLSLFKKKDSGSKMNKQVFQPEKVI